MTGRHNRIERTSMSPIFPVHIQDSPFAQPPFCRDSLRPTPPTRDPLVTLTGDLPPEERSRLETACKEADREIDKLVYELYRLTEEEIAVVEGVV